MKKYGIKVMLKIGESLWSNIVFAVIKVFLFITEINDDVGFVKFEVFQEMSRA